MYNHRVLILKYSGGFKSLEACKACYKQAIEWARFFLGIFFPPENKKKKQMQWRFSQTKTFLGINDLSR